MMEMLLIACVVCECFVRLENNGNVCVYSKVCVFDCVCVCV